MLIARASGFAISDNDMSEQRTTSGDVPASDGLAIDRPGSDHLNDLFRNMLMSMVSNRRYGSGERLPTAARSSSASL
jgi:hypothetical protein